MKLYQPIYQDKDGNITSVSTVVFKTHKEAVNYGKFICKRIEQVEVIEIEVIK